MVAFFVDTLCSPQGELSPGEDEGFEEPHHIQQGIFGVLYTVCKEQYMTSYGFAFFRLFIDFLQLWLLVVNPAYGFAIDADNAGWKAVSLINLNWFLAERGYMFFLVLFYIFVGLLLLNVGLSVWVAHQFSNNRFDQVWPIVFLRWFGLIFYQVLDVATLTLLLAALDCQFFNVPKEVQFHSQLFPTQMCWAMPHLIHVAVAVVAIIVFVVMAGAMVVSQMDLNPMTRHYMGIMHTRTEGYSFIIKTIATIASVMVNSTKWLSILYIVCFVVLMYLQYKWVPFTFAVSNYVRGASYAAVLYSSVLLIPLAFGSPSDPEGRHDFSHNITIALDLEPGTNTKYIHKFEDAREVEVVLRNTRQWLDEDTPDPDSVKLGEAIVKAGLAQLSNNPQMFILFSSYLIDVQGSYQSGLTQLQVAKKQSPGILERFAIFSREQEHTQKASGANGGAGAAVDLVSYVEFQRSHRLVTRAHKEALMAMRAFWGLLMHSNVNFIKLTKAMNRIEVTVRVAERAYRGVLTRHSTNARLVRLYGRFLESVKFDPWAASKWFAEAERLEEMEEQAKESMQLSGSAELSGKGIVEGVACIFIDSQGIIQVASPEAHALLGFNKNELKGKDLGIILPPPFGEKHHVLVRNYIASGVSHGILDHTNEFVAISKTRQVVPVRLKVSKVSGLSEDSVFMGTLEAVPNPPHTACAWLLGGGGGAAVGGVMGFGITLIAADDRFLDWLGYDVSELVGQAVGGLLEDEEILNSAFKHLWNLHQSLVTAKATVRKGGRHASFTMRDREAGRESAASMGLLGFPHAATADGAAAAGAGVPASQPALGGGGGQQLGGALTPTATLSLGWRHKYSGVVYFKTRLKIGTIGSVRHMTVTMEADWKLTVPRPGGRGGLPGILSELMLVADNKGKILHVTTALAAALGRSADIIRQGGIDMLLPEPYTILHGPWLSALALPPGQAVAGGLDANTSAPPHSCRSGVAVSLCGFDEAEGPVTRPFKLQMQQRLVPKLGQRVHVLSLEQLTKEQAAAQRRLKLTVDMNGGITGADDAPAKLFGVDPKSLVGTALGELVDLFCTDEALRTINDTVGEMAGEGRKGTGSGSGGKVDEDLLAGVAGVFNAANSRQTTRMLLELARRSSESDGISWRVGVTLPPDPAAAAELEELSRGLTPDDVAVASRLIGGKVVPAVMRVRLVKRDANIAKKLDARSWHTSRLSDSAHGDYLFSKQRAGSVTWEDEGNAATGAAGSGPPPKWVISWESNGGPHRQASDARLSGFQLPEMPLPPRAPLPPAPAPPPPLAGGGAAGSRASSFDMRTGMQQAADVETLGSLEPGQGQLAQEPSSSGGLVFAAGGPAGGASPGSSGPAPAAAALPGADAARPLTPGSLMLANDLDRPSSLRLAAPPDLRSTAGATPGSFNGGQGALAAAAAAVIAAKPAPPYPPSSPAMAAAAVAPSSPPTAAAQATHATRGGAELHRLAQSSSSTALSSAAAAAVATVKPPPGPPLTSARSSSPRSPSSLAPTPSITAAAAAAGVRTFDAQVAAAKAAASGTARSADATGQAGGIPGGDLFSFAAGLGLDLHGAAATAPAPRIPRGGLLVSAAEEPAPALYIEVELWRADLLTGVVEVDERGRVLRIDPTDDLGQAALVLGAAKAELTGCNINSLLPLPAGGFLSLYNAGGAGAGGAGAPLRGALKSRKKNRDKEASAPCTLAARHMGDACVTSLRLQAVKRSGPYGTYYLMLRPEEPTPVQPGFVRWLTEGDTSGLAQRTQLGVQDPAAYRDTAQGYATGPARGEAALLPGGGSVAGALAAAFGAGPAAGAPRTSRKNVTELGLTAPNGPGCIRRASGFLPAHQPSPLTAAAPRSRAATSLGLSSMAAAPLPPPLPPPVLLSGGLENLRVAPMRGGEGPNGGRRATTGPAGDAASAPATLQAVLPRPNGSGGEDSAYDPSMPPALVAGLQNGGSASAQERLMAHGPGGTSRRSRGSDPTQNDGLGSADGAEPAKGAVLLLPGQPGSADEGGDVVDPELLTSAQQDYSGLVKPSKLVPSIARSNKDAKLAAVSSWVMSGGSQHLAAAGDASSAAATHDHRHDDGGDRSNDNSEGGDRLSSEEEEAAGSPLGREAADADARVRQGLAAGGGGVGGNGGPRNGDGNDNLHTAEQQPWMTGAARGSSDPHVGAADESTGVEDEAGAHVTNYGAGKRFKKIYKLLTSPQAQRASWLLQLQALAVVGLLMVAHTVTFAIMMTHLQVQTVAVTDLSAMGLAATRVHEIALRCRTLAELFDSRAQQAPRNVTDITPLMAGVPTFGGPYNESVADVLDSLGVAVVNLKVLQNGIYLGFDKAARIPARHGLRDIWDLPHVNITKYFDKNDADGSVMAVGGLQSGINQPYNTSAAGTVQMSLWDAANLFVSQALEVVQNSVPLVERGVDFKMWSAYRFVVENGLDDIWPAYLDSIDAMVQIVVEDGQQVYTIQLIMVCMEGGLVLIAAVIYMWWAASKFVGTRYALYSVFVHLPLGLTRTLANMSITLEPGEEDEDDVALGLEAAAAAGGGAGGGDAGADAADREEEPHPNGKGGTAARMLRIDSSAFKGRRGGAHGGPARLSESFGKLGSAEQGSLKRYGSKLVGVDGRCAVASPSDAFRISITTKSATAAVAGDTTGMQRVLALASFLGGRNKVHASKQAHQKRRLVPSYRVALFLVMPFVIWGIILVCVNAAGFAELAGNGGSIASLSVLHTVVIRLHRLLYYSLDLAASFGTDLVEACKTTLRWELADATLEYSVLLYGHEALAWAASNHSRTLTHLALAPAGIIYSGDKVTNIVYKTRGCLCELPEECQPPDSPYYEVTRNGMDVLAKAQFLAVESLLNQIPPNASGGMNSTEFRFMWSTFETDVEGGVDALLGMYREHVQWAYQGVRAEQIILFVTGWVWAFIFTMLILRPFLRRAHQEMRRIAELLSQLPAEVDVETMVAQVVAFGFPNLKRLLASTAKSLPEISSDDLVKKLDGKESVLVLDVRSAEELPAGIIKGSLNLPTPLFKQPDTGPVDKAIQERIRHFKEVVVHCLLCAPGKRGPTAAAALQARLEALGVAPAPQVRVLTGGVDAFMKLYGARSDLVTLPPGGWKPPAH
ncbi:hypothetical protein HXX76_009794 [Chlamydomonas incerta]|uniref:PAS domain-containing protein n=1 Tax=Chlamydomonas incerta TaxID=51695 RepID=A0A835SVV2_CHLIN|nr:hypothetical protein HXX76_009794 [Chlamydomonas incerta]|eukprot:KAG2430818.1 hypothetical protein HXX76_009794 [Chlamydomonas incerta]